MGSRRRENKVVIKTIIKEAETKQKSIKDDPDADDDMSDDTQPDHTPLGTFMKLVD